METVWPFWLQLALFTAAGLCALSAYIWRGRATEGGGSLVVLITAVAAWVLCSGLEHALLDVDAKLWLAKTSWLPIAAVPLATFVVALHATGRGDRLTRGRLFALALPALAMVGLVFTNESHGWVWKSVTLNLEAPYPDLDLPHGPAFWAWVAFGYGLLGVSFCLLAAHYVRQWPRNREEAVLVSLAVLAPWSANVYYLLNEARTPSLDLTPYAFSISAVCLSLALWRGQGILNVVRVARSQILDEMSDGTLVVDARARLVYANLAARRTLGLAEVLHPVPVARVLASHPDLLHALGRERLASEEVSIHEPEGEWRTFDVRVTTLRAFQGAASSRVLVLRDVTESRRAQSAQRDSEVLLRKVIDLVPHMVFARDERGELLLANETMATNLDVMSEETGGPRVSRQIQRRRAEQFRRMRREDLEVIRTGEPVHRVEVPWVDLDGVEHTYELNKIPFTDPSSGDPALLGIAIDVTQRKRTEEQIRKLAFFDTLTGLPNRQRFRTLLENALGNARRSRGRAALLFLDLDRFKQVNDRHGHALGDALLRIVGERLRECVRFSDQILGGDGNESTVSRLGGDEFTILLAEIGEPLDAAVVATRILESLGRSIVVDGQEVQTGASIGIAVYPDDAPDADALFRHADQAMYDAKGRGRSRYAFFRPELTEASERRHAIEEGLRRALQCEELRLHYQLQRHARSGDVVGVEALLRWTHPELGDIAPREAVKVAEDCGLIVPLGEWVLRAACRQFESWREARLAPVPISVNVSGYQLHHPGLLPFLTALLEDSGMSPGMLDLDIVESTLMSDDEATQRNLKKLRAMGVGFTLDDFGTGYSSLSCLREFPFDCVKLDRSFVEDVVSDLTTQALTRGVIDMAHGLGLRVVAEGVETWEQLEFLREAACDALQGHLIGEATPADDLTHFLRSEKPE